MRTSPPILGALAATLALLGCTSGEPSGETPADGAGTSSAEGGAKESAAPKQDPGRQAASHAIYRSNCQPASGAKRSP